MDINSGITFVDKTSLKDNNYLWFYRPEIFKTGIIRVTKMKDNKIGSINI